MKNNGWAVLLGVDDAYFAEQISHYSGTIRHLVLSLAGCMVVFMGVVIFLQVMYNHDGRRKSAGLQHLAETDQLTGLYNKVTTERKIKIRIPRVCCLCWILIISKRSTIPWGMRLGMRF